MKKLIAAVAIVLATGFGLTAPAMAQQYPPTLSVLAAVSDGSVVLTATGCQVGETVSFVVTSESGTVVASVTATSEAGGAGSARPMQAAAGTATATIARPAPGTFTVTSTCMTSGLKGTTTFTISAVQTTTTLAAAGGGGLPATGSDSTPTLWIAASAVIVGAGLTIVAWRRRHHASA